MRFCFGKQVHINLSENTNIALLYTREDLSKSTIIFLQLYWVYPVLVPIVKVMESNLDAANNPNKYSTLFCIFLVKFKFQRPITHL